MTNDLLVRLAHALGSKSHAAELVNAIQPGQSQATQDVICIPAVITATGTSTTTDFGALKVGDIVIHIPAVAGNAIFYTVATIGTLPAAAVSGDLYIVLRAFVAPATASITL